MLKILIADSEFLEREVIKKIGYEINEGILMLESAGSSETIKLASEFKPNIIFLSAQLGGVSTRDILKEFRYLKLTSNIVIMNSYHNKDIEELQNYSVKEFLIKPISTEKIRVIIENFLEHNNINENKIPKSSKTSFISYPKTLLSKEIKDTLDYINNNINEDLSLDYLANRVYLSNYYLSRLFKKEVGVTISSYIIHKKMENAKKLLLETDKNILEISTFLNFKEQTYFCKVFKTHVGVSPTEFRKKIN